MNNKDEKISANEINKYLYCPYQWYYERYYGRKHIQELYRRRNKELGLEDTTMSNFHRGLTFHNGYESADRKRRLVRNLFAGLVVIVLLSLLFFVLKGFFGR